MTNNINVLPVGCKVKIGPAGEIEAVVTGISIYANAQTKYQVVWWDGNTRKEGWLQQIEVHAEDKQELQAVGFARKS